MDPQTSFIHKIKLQNNSDCNICNFFFENFWGGGTLRSPLFTKFIKILNISDWNILQSSFGKISGDGPADPLYSQINLQNNSDCNICNLFFLKMSGDGPPDPPFTARTSLGHSPLFHVHSMNKCSGFTLFNVGRSALLQ